MDQTYRIRSQQRAFQLGRAAHDRLEIREPHLDMDWVALTQGKTDPVVNRLRNAWFAGFDSPLTHP
ncbi:MAG: hypothetical protein K8S54_10405 [Spirochaetia bacterium]|nr:hypothetical protein [Spirochaetia bacterium]